MTTWTLVLPYSRPPLSANQRLHWAQKARITRQIRRDAFLLAKAAKIPACERIIVRMEYLPRDKRRRDPSNLMPTQKAVVDGLIDAGVVPDDCPPFVTEWMPRIEVCREPIGASGARMRVYIDDVSP